MATHYVLDTHFYVDVLRSGAGSAAAQRFLATHLASVEFHAFVGAELLMGAVDRAAAAAIRQRLIERFPPQRTIVPDAGDLLAAGDAIRTLRERGGDHPEHARRNFWNDVVIAVSCRRRGRTLVSSDADHRRIAAVVGHRVLAALPA